VSHGETVLKKKDAGIFLFYVMAGAYALAIGATINGLFAFLLGGEEERGEPLRIFFVALCFALGATMIRLSLKRRSGGKK
jgi:amino acid permease